MAQINQRELEANTRALHKAFAGSEPPAKILDIIKTLRNLGDPSEEMLRQTKAGVIVGKMRSNPNKDIARAATELVQKWRKAVENEKKGRTKPAGSASPAAPAPSNATPSPLPSRAKGQPFRGNPEKRSFREDGVDINRTSSKVRNGCIGLMYNGLAFRSTENENDILVKAQAVEAASFKKHGGETTGYKEQMRSLMLNLKNKSNRELGLNVMSGRISPERLVNMTGDELKSEERKKEDEKLMNDNIKNAQVAQEAKSVSAELMCGKCGERKVSYTQAQTRSADEPMTTFCECLNCGKRWKFS